MMKGTAHMKSENVPKIVNLKRWDWLVELVNHNKLKIGAEVGVASGDTTFRLLSHCNTLEVLYAVDDFRPMVGGWRNRNTRKEFMAQYHKLKVKDRLHLIEGISWEVAASIPDGSLDFVFIDADHDFNSVRNDLNAWVPKVKKGGFVTGHDLHFAGVRQALAYMNIQYNKANIDNVWWYER